MKHINHGKRLAHFKKRYKHIAAAFAGAILMSSALLPGLPIAHVHASANPVGNTRDTSAKKIQNRNQEERTAGQSVRINQNPHNITRSNVSRSEAINRIKQIFNANKTLRAAPQLPATDNKANQLVTPTSDKKYSPPNAVISPVNEGKTESVATTSKDTKYTPPAAPSPTNESKVDTPPAKNPEKEYSPPPPAPPSPNEQKEEKPKQANPEPEKVPTKPTPTKQDAGEKQPSGAPTQYEKVLDITATAYAPGPLDNDQWGDKTYMGTTIRPGVIAVDPKVIPLGSRLYVEYPDGHGEYKVAEDTGGAIKGNRIDIAIMNRDKATDFGIKPVKVYVVETPKE